MSYFVRIAYSAVCYLNVSFSILNSSFGKERAGFSAIDYSYFCCFCSTEFHLLRVLGIGYVILLWHFLGLPLEKIGLVGHFTSSVRHYYCMDTNFLLKHYSLKAHLT